MSNEPDASDTEDSEDSEAEGLSAAEEEIREEPAPGLGPGAEDGAEHEEPSDDE